MSPGAIPQSSVTGVTPAESPSALLGKFRPAISIVTVLVLWETAARLGWINSFLFPPPTHVLASLWRQAGPAGDPPYAIVFHVLKSLYRLFAGIGLAVVVGTILGLSVGMTRWGRAVFKPIISFIMPVPTLAWTPVLLLVFGVDDRTTIAVVFIASSFEIIYNVVAGVEMLNVRVLWVAQSMGASRSQTFWKVIVPGILPYLIIGLKLGVGYAWRALIAAEMLAASSYGLGFMIYDASEYMSMDIIYAGMIVISALGYLIENVLIGRLEAVTVQKWGVQVER
jgi:taurine transport system permease protein